MILVGITSNQWKTVAMNSAGEKPSIYIQESNVELATIFKKAREVQNQKLNAALQNVYEVLAQINDAAKNHRDNVFAEQKRIRLIKSKLLNKDNKSEFLKNMEKEQLVKNIRARSSI